MVVFDYEMYSGCLALGVLMVGLHTRVNLPCRYTARTIQVGSTVSSRFSLEPMADHQAPRGGTPPVVQ
jgi:hypothetical protein